MPHDHAGEPEVFDIIDEQGRTIGSATRREVHDKRLLHRVVHVHVHNGHGVLLQRRAAHLRVYPDLWTSSATGHVDAGEKVEAAAERELMEEIGVKAAKLVEVGRVRHDDLAAGEKKLIHVFVGETSGAPKHDPKEVSDVRAVMLDELDREVREHPERFAASFLATFPVAAKALSRNGSRVR